jgi:hypothetical protein
VSGPFLHIAGLWAEADEADTLAAYLRDFECVVPEGFNKGQVVSFRYEVANSVPFRVTMSRLDMAELNDRPNSAAPQETSTL